MVKRPNPPLQAREHLHFLDNPYWAPLTQPLKNIVAFAYTPIRQFSDAVTEGLKGHRTSYFGSATTKMGIIAENLFANSSGPHTVAITVIGALGGVLMAGATAGIGAYSAMAGASVIAHWGAALSAGVAGAGIGMVAGPVVLAGVVAFAGAILGVTLGAVPGFVSGVAQAVKHHKVLAAGVTNSTSVPSVPTPTQKFNELFANFRLMPKAEQDFIVQTLLNGGIAEGQGKSARERILNTVDALPKVEREKLVRDLREKLATDFADVSDKDARAATVLEEKLIVEKPLKIMPRKAAVPNAGSK